MVDTNEARVIAMMERELIAVRSEFNAARGSARFWKLIVVFLVIGIGVVSVVNLQRTLAPLQTLSSVVGR